MRRKNEKKKKGFIFVLFVAVFLMAVGYAVYSSDLIINATGKILSDWDIKFTKVAINSGSTLKSTATGGAVAMDAGDMLSVTATNGAGEIEIDVWAALTYFDDKVIYDIDITNYSEMFDAELVTLTIEYFEDAAMEDPLTTHFIDWEVSSSLGVAYTAGTQTPGTLKILKGTSTTPTTSKIQLKAFWNAALAGTKTVPDDAIKDLATTHVEYAKITLTFEAAE